MELNKDGWDDETTVGSDASIRERPRGLICNFDEGSFTNQSVAVVAETDDYIVRVSHGVWIYGNKTASPTIYHIVYRAWSWIFDKIFNGALDNGGTLNPNSNFGFLDMNMLRCDYLFPTNLMSYTEVLWGVNDDGGDGTLVGCRGDGNQNQIRLGIGFTYMKNAWKGHTAFLCSTQVRNADAYKYIFDFQTNRQSTNYSNSNFPYNAGEGTVEYANRYFLGAREPLLSFGSDNNSRFFFSQLFQPMQVQNTFREGTQAVGTKNLTTTATDPIFNLVGELSDGVSYNSGTDATAGYDVNIPDNQEAGNDAVFYQTRNWNVYHDGIPMFACEVPKHQPMFFQPKNSAEPDINAYSGNHPMGETFMTSYPILDDGLHKTRFFMFTQQARANTWTVSNEISARYPQEYDPTYDPYNNPPDPPQGIIDTVLFTGQNNPSAFWGCMAGDKVGYLNRSRQLGQLREFQAGTDCPRADKIYDAQGGVALSDFIIWKRGNWDKSLWATMGFTYSDLNPDPFIGSRNIRNFTKNFLQTEVANPYADNAFLTQSVPLTTNADLTGSGFIQDTTSIIGERNYTGVSPMNQLIFTGNIQTEYYNSVLLKTLTNEVSGGALKGQIVVYNTRGGSNEINNELFDNQFFNLKIASSLPYGSYILASGVPAKLEIPYFFVKSDLVECNSEFVNNAAYPSQMPVVAVIAKQYGATSDWYYSDNQFSNTYVNKKRRVITSIKTELIDSNGKLASTLLDKSALFVKISRANPVTPFVVSNPEDLELREKITDEKKETKDEYHKEIDAYLGIMGMDKSRR
jgi:ABC-type cobalt transport system substrate-binding protein